MACLQVVQAVPVESHPFHSASQLDNSCRIQVRAHAPAGLPPHLPALLQPLSRSASAGKTLLARLVIPGFCCIFCLIQRLLVRPSMLLPANHPSDTLLPSEILGTLVLRF